jgi:hypothetical protein
MLLAQGRFWRASLAKDSVELELLKASLPEELEDLRELRFEVPLGWWNRLVKHVRSDRKLLGGVLLDFARPKDRVSAAIGDDRLLGELQRVVLEASSALVEEEILELRERSEEA